jgi:hypothetical protein
LEKLDNIEADVPFILPIINGKRPHVAICLASLDLVHFKFTEQSWAPLVYNSQPDFDKSINIMRGTMSVGQKRDHMVTRMLQDKNVSHIFMLDNDIIYEGINGDLNGAIRYMMWLNLPICGGLMRVRGLGFPYMVYNYIKKDDAFKPVPDKDLKDRGKIVEVDGIGMGCTLIKREVFEAIEKPYFLQDKWTEDFYFEWKAREAGFKTYAVCDIQCSHINWMKIKCNGTIANVDD